MGNPRPEEENSYRCKKPFQIGKTKKETTDTTMKDMMDFLKLEKENKEIEGRIFRDIRNVFRREKEKEINDIILKNIGNRFENEEEEK